MSLLIGLIYPAIFLLGRAGFRLPFSLPAASGWAVVIAAVILGLIGLYLGVVGFRRAHGLTRLIAILGAILSTLLAAVGVLLGLFLAFPPQIQISI